MFLRVVRAFVSLLNRRSLKYFVVTSELTKSFDGPFKVSWSQGAEDLAILGTLPKVENGTYIDIGAFHPSKFSTTRHLYQRGWRGINVDANHQLLKAFLLERPEDKSLCCAVGEKDYYELNILSELGMSTVNANWLEYAKDHGVRPIEKQTVKGRSLRSIYDEFFPEKACTLLSIDIEGADFEALKSLSFESLSQNRYPDWILLETFPPVGRAINEASVKLAIGFGYEPVLVLPMATLLTKYSLYNSGSR